MNLRAIGLTGVGAWLTLIGCGGSADLPSQNAGGQAAYGGQTTSPTNGGSSSVGSSGVGSSSAGGARAAGGNWNSGGASISGGSPAIGGVPAAGGATSGSCIASDGTTYPSGVAFLAADGCNTCSCAGTILSCTHRACPVGCTYQGIQLTDGESMPAGDGCNTCTCQASSPTGTAAVACTTIDCVGSCQYAGRMVGNGESLAATDGCNKCSCSNGSILCSKAVCACNPTNEYWRAYVATNTSTCAVIDFACPAGSTGFANGCGCGCEQSTDCPSVFTCVRTASDAYFSGVGGASSKIAPPLTGGATGNSGVAATGGAIGASDVAYPTPCATPALMAQCPLTPVEPILI